MCENINENLIKAFVFQNRILDEHNRKQSNDVSPISRCSLSGGTHRRELNNSQLFSKGIYVQSVTHFSFLLFFFDLSHQKLVVLSVSLPFSISVGNNLLLNRCSFASSFFVNKAIATADSGVCLTDTNAKEN